MPPRSPNATYTRFGDHSLHLRKLVEETERMGGNHYRDIYLRLKKQRMEKDTWEVELAEEGTPLADFQKFRTEVVSELLDGPNKDGIFRTSRLYAKLDKYFEKTLLSHKEQMIQEVEKLRKERTNTVEWGHTYNQGKVDGYNNAIKYFISILKSK